MKPALAHDSIGLLDSPYLTLEEGARYLRFDTCEKPTIQFQKWLKRHRVPITRRGRVLLVERRHLEAALIKGR